MHSPSGSTRWRVPRLGGRSVGRGRRSRQRAPAARTVRRALDARAPGNRPSRRGVASIPELRERLGDESGVEPSAELTALERFIVAASPTTDAAVRAPVATRLHHPRTDRHRRVRRRLPGHATGTRSRRRAQGDPPGARQLTRVHPTLRGRGTVGRAARASQHRAALRLLARSERRLSRLPPAARPQCSRSPRVGVGRSHSTR